MQIRKGALLLPAADGTFLPWAVAGFDTTTRHRLRISSDMLNELTGESWNAVVLDSEHPYTPFKQVFSNREYALLEKIFVFAVRQGAAANGILIISEPLNLVDSIPAHFFTDLNALLFEALQQSNPKTGNNEQISTEQLFIDYMENLTRKENKVFLLILNLGKTVQSIQKQYPEIDTFRIKQEITDAFALIVTGTGRLFQFNSEKLLLSLPYRSSLDEDLLKSQIALSLQRIYKISFPLDDLIFMQYPDDINTVDNIFAILEEKT